MQFVFVDSLVVFAIIWLLYYLLCYSFFKGQSFAKAITDLQLIANNKIKFPNKQLLVREFSKISILLIIPGYLLDRIQNDGSSKFIFLSILTTAFVIVTLGFNLFRKKTWWESLSRTRTIKNQITNKQFRLISLTSILGIFIITIVFKIYPFKNIQDFKTSFYPKYPINNVTKNYADFINTHSQDPVDYVFGLFEKYDLVVLSERLHPEYTQYELITKIVTDKRFADKVGNIYTECGSISFQDTLDTYLKTIFPDENSLNKATAFLQRNSNAIWPLWSNTNLFDLLKYVNKVNSNLTDSSKIHWYFTDIPINWETMTPAKYQELPQDNKRDKIMANHIINTYKNKVERQEKRKKGLVIMNFRHGYGLIKDDKGRKKNHPYNQNNTTAFLMDSLPGKVCNIFINTISFRFRFIFTPIQHGKWDRAFSTVGNPNVGFNFENSPFGIDKFDGYVGSPSDELKYKDVFTGFIFYKPLEQHIQKEGFPYMLHNFQDSVLRRAKCVSVSHAKNWEKRIESLQKDKIYTEPMHYAAIYNLIVNIGFSILVFWASIITLIFYWAKRKSKKIISNKVYVS